MRALLLALLAAGLLSAQAKRILYITHSAGFRHGSIETSRDALAEIARRSGKFSVTASEDLALISEENLRQYDALFFFTSGELALSAAQKQALLAWVRSGKGFGGAHSATDTLYSWAEYGELIGGYFDGHPWTHPARIDVEDSLHPATRGLGGGFTLLEEFYQFRSFSRGSVRVLMTLDTASVDLRAPGVNRTDGDFALAWCRNYGDGRVFYTALGHFDETWKDARFQTMLEGALLWLLREADGAGAPVAARPLARMLRAGEYPGEWTGAPGAIVAIDGENLTNGSALAFESAPFPRKLAGAQVLADGSPAPLLSAAASRIVLQLPYDLRPGQTVPVTVVSSGLRGDPVAMKVEAATPAIVAVEGERRPRGTVAIYATGLGATQPAQQAGTRAPSDELVKIGADVIARANGAAAQVLFAGLTPGFAGLYQVNIILPEGIAGRTELVLEIGGLRSPAYVISLE